MIKLENINPDFLKQTNTNTNTKTLNTDNQKRKKRFRIIITCIPLAAVGILPVALYGCHGGKKNDESIGKSNPEMMEETTKNNDNESFVKSVVELPRLISIEKFTYPRYYKLSDRDEENPYVISSNGIDVNKVNTVDVAVEEQIQNIISTPEGYVVSKDSIDEWNNTDKINPEEIVVGIVDESKQPVEFYVSDEDKEKAEEAGIADVIGETEVVKYDDPSVAVAVNPVTGEETVYENESEKQKVEEAKENGTFIPETTLYFANDGTAFLTQKECDEWNAYLANPTTSVDLNATQTEAKVSQTYEETQPTETTVAETTTVAPTTAAPTVAETTTVAPTTTAPTVAETTTQNSSNNSNTVVIDGDTYYISTDGLYFGTKEDCDAWNAWLIQEASEAEVEMSTEGYEKKLTK